MKNLENLTDSEKINYLIQKIDQIDRTLNPPFWKQALTWFVNHFWTLALLAVMGYALWQVWETVQYVQSGVEAVEVKLESLKGGVSQQFKGLSEALGSIKNFDVDELKFWE